MELGHEAPLLCLWLPSWPVQWRNAGRRRAEERGRPLVVSAPVQGKDRVVACSRSARRRGITVGMLQADAESLAGRGVRFEAHDPLADVQRLRELVAVCHQLSPTAAVEPGERPEALLPWTPPGAGSGSGASSAFAGQVVNAARQRGYWAFAAMADTVGAAWAVARYGAGRLCSNPNRGPGSALWVPANKSRPCGRWPSRHCECPRGPWRCCAS